MSRLQGSPRVASSLWTLSAALLIACFLVLAFLGIHGQDITTDEACYFGVGKTIIETHEWKGTCGQHHPPLSYYVNSLPLFWLGEPPSERNAFHLLLSRLTSLVVFAVPLLIVVFLWARDLYGRSAALVALALASFSPTLLAHAALITPDVPVTAAGFLAVYFFRRSGEGARGVLPWGVAIGLTLLAKGSAWLFVACLLLLATAQARRKPSVGRVRAFLMGLAVAWLVVNVGYGFKGFLDWDRKAALIAKVPDLPLARAAAWSAAPLLPLPYLQATATQLNVGQRGWPAFLMGEVSRTGWWYYFLVAFLIKETLPFLLLLGVSTVAMVWARGEWSDEITLIVPPVLFFALFGFVGRVQVGIRYVLPAFPFLFVFASKVARLGWGGRWPVRIFLGGLLCWHGASAWGVCPHFIAYFNELVGGPRNGYRYLVDSNLDWGQNRSRVEDHARRHGVLIEPAVLPPTGLVAVGATRLQGVFGRERYRLLRDEYDPVDHIGYNWLIYDLGRPRFAPESIVPVMSDSSWVASGRFSPDREGPDFDPRLWESAVVVSSEKGDEFVPYREYPGTAATLIRCRGAGAECLFRRSFNLEGLADRAMLYFAARDRYEFYLNDSLIAARASCAPTFVKEEHQLESHLRRGPNVIAIRLTACGEGSPHGLFLEMRVAQRRGPP